MRQSNLPISIKSLLSTLSLLCLLGCGATTTAAPATIAETADKVVAQVEAAASRNETVTAESRRGQSRGYLTTPEELANIRLKAAQGVEPYQEAVKSVLSQAQRKWDYRLKARETCKGADNPAWIDEERGIARLYARALAYHLTGDSNYAHEVKEILGSIMTQVEQIDIDQQQCRLNFGWGTPELVAAADLIEAYWQDEECTGPLSTLYMDVTLGAGNCKRLFQNWLVKNPYYIISYTAEEAKSNWGAAATNATAYIADYLWDRSDVHLIHRLPERYNAKKFEEITFTAAEAYRHANQLMFDRMNGYGVELHSSKACDYMTGSQQHSAWTPVKSQISENGILPEDARREEYCNVERYNGEYQNYPQVHLGNNIQQCELLLRRGDSSCYDNVDLTDLPHYVFLDAKGEEQTTHLYPGRGSIERAIKAIIVDTQTEWRHDEALAVAYRYYYNHHTLPGFEIWFEQLDRPGNCSQDICFGTLTHGFASDETPGPPPTVAPPQ